MQPETPNTDSNAPKPTDAAEPVQPMPVGTSITPDNNVAQSILEGQQVVQPAVVTEQPHQEVPDQHVANNILGVVSNPQVVASAMPTPPAKKSKKLPLIAGIVALVLVVGGGYTFGLYLPAQPNNVYKAGLSRSGKAADALVKYGTSQQSLLQKQGAKFDITTNVKSSGGSFDLAAKGAYDMNANVDAQITADVMGSKLSANIRSISSGKGATPDLYLQVNGAASLLKSTGFNGLSSLDGQWISIDHTLLDSYKSELSKNITADTTKQPTRAQVTDAITKVQAVNKQYLFTTDSTKAVLKDPKFVAKEQLSGHQAYHYTVGYDKAHLASYLQAVANAIDTSSLGPWIKSTNDGKALGDSQSFKDSITQINKANANYTFGLWVDAKTKLIAQLKFADPKDAANTVAISQQYTGGTKYPFTLDFASKADQETSSGHIGFTLDTRTNAVTFDGKGSLGSTGSFTFSGSLQPTSEAVKPQVPTGAKPITDVINQLSTSGVLGASTTKGQSQPATPTVSPLERLRSLL